MLIESRTTGFLKTADGQVETLRIRPAGGDSGTVLVLLHEGLGCIDLWRKFPQQLAVRSGFGVFAYSRIGYGRSDPCTLPRPLTYMHHEAERVLPEVLASLEAETIILAGHSDGASIAAIHAGGTPDPRLRGLILMAPHFFAEDGLHPFHRRGEDRVRDRHAARRPREISRRQCGLRVPGLEQCLARPGNSCTGISPDSCRTSGCRCYSSRGRKISTAPLRQLDALKRHLPVLTGYPRHRRGPPFPPS